MRWTPRCSAVSLDVLERPADADARHPTNSNTCSRHPKSRMTSRNSRISPLLPIFPRHRDRARCVRRHLHPRPSALSHPRCQAEPRFVERYRRQCPRAGLRSMERPNPKSISRRHWPNCLHRRFPVWGKPPRWCVDAGDSTYRRRVPMNRRRSPPNPSPNHPLRR